MPALGVDLVKGDHCWLSPAAGADSMVLRLRWVPLQPWLLALPIVGALLRGACARHASLVASLGAALVSDQVAARPLGAAAHRLMVPPLLMRRLFRRWAAVLDLRDDECDPQHALVSRDWDGWLAASEAPVATEDGESLGMAGAAAIGGLLESLGGGGPGAQQGESEGEGGLSKAGPAAGGEDHQDSGLRARQGTPSAGKTSD